MHVYIIHNILVQFVNTFCEKNYIKEDKKNLKKGIQNASSTSTSVERQA